VKVKILEIDSERRRLSLSIKRVEDQILPRREAGAAPAGDAGDMDDMPELGLSEDVFADAPEGAAPDEPLAEAVLPDEPTVEESVAAAASEEEAPVEPVADEPAAPDASAEQVEEEQS
jgi:small subunit ribosomal protein S1